MKKLIDIGLVHPITTNEHGADSEFKSVHPFFHPVRHIPPTNPYKDLNISPVEGKTFAALESMQNVKWLTKTGGVNKNVCKYIGKIDENNMVIVRSHPHDNGTLISKKTFLHNTKITSSEINEKLALEKKREKNSLEVEPLVLWK